MWRNGLMSQYDDIEKLLGLKEKGIITQEEFETHKNKLLNQVKNYIYKQ